MTQWKENRGENVDTVTWDYFIDTFLDRFLPRELIETKSQTFMNFEAWFSVSPRVWVEGHSADIGYAPQIVVDLRAQMSKFLFGVPDLVNTK